MDERPEDALRPARGCVIAGLIMLAGYACTGFTLWLLGLI